MPNTQIEYKRQRSLLDNLMTSASHQKDKHITNLIKLIARNLKLYEDEHFFIPQSTPVEILKFLMKEHGLTQRDLPEIGSQSLVSKILSGGRKLTAEQIANLARRFHVSPAVFIL
jgi:HTH-type transcriptional regulator / antitoxin HigA